MKTYMTRHKTLSKYFGYPECCVKSFLSDATGNYSHNQFKKYPKHPARGTGYVPCKDCIEKSWNEVVKKINSKRICPVEYPRSVKFEDAIEDMLELGMLTQYFTQKMLNGEDKYL